MTIVFAESTDVYVPDGVPLEMACQRATHLAIGAHQDDLEFMAYHGIAECFRAGTPSFFGIILTDGVGSARAGPYANTSDEEMARIRIKEQREAARIAQYSAVVQYGFSSSVLKENHKKIAAHLSPLLGALRPHTVYLHNPFDRHVTHIAAFLASLAALRDRASTHLPERIWGCEVWRGLDWFPDDLKVMLDVSFDPAFAAQLHGVFRSQIGAGKRYDDATVGRWQANATFFRARDIDATTRAAIAVNLLPLVQDAAIEPSEWCASIIDRFRAEVTSALRAYQG